jgi:protein arginine N-methyltransferase 5
LADYLFFWAQYDVVTTPVTNAHFHSRVLALLSSSSAVAGWSTPRIPQLTAADTMIIPGDSTSQLVAVASPWIDLCSPDPVIAGVSQQVLHMEVAFASFCGISNIMIAGPNLSHDPGHADGLSQYALAINQALGIGNFMTFAIVLPMDDEVLDTLSAEVVGSLAPLGRDEFSGSQSEDKDGADGADIPSFDPFGAWQTWHTIRTLCKYNQRLYVGKVQIEFGLVSIAFPHFLLLFPMVCGWSVRRDLGPALRPPR